MSNIVALLDSMWNWRGCHEGDVDAARYFHINADNHSGRRLYRLVGNHSLLVTNSCRKMQSSANHHGEADGAWVLENLELIAPFDLLLVCGTVARKVYTTWLAEKYPNAIIMDHPAARRWSNAKLDAMTKEIERRLA